MRETMSTTKILSSKSKVVTINSFISISFNYQVVKKSPNNSIQSLIELSIGQIDFNIA